MPISRRRSPRRSAQPLSLGQLKAGLCALSCALCISTLPSVGWAQPVVVAPEVVERVEPIYPTDGAAEGTAILTVTVERDGAVSLVELFEGTGDVDLDSAAVEAVSGWRFTPAKRDGQPIRAKIRVACRVEPPTFTEAPKREPSPPAAPPVAEVELAEPSEVEVHGTKSPRAEARGASSFDIGRDVLEAAPAREGADLLQRTPGLFVGRSAGPAVAHRYMLRGFDADHGQDIAFRVGGIPINLPSHIHGQGYADMGILIGEAVARLRVSEGVYDPHQGDFAVAGSIDVDLGVARRGWLVESSYGSFDTYRQLALWAPEGEADETFGAASYERTDGFGENRKASVANAVFQARFGSSSSWSYRALGMLHAARADTAGVLRADDVAAGRVDFYGVYPLATAERQNALSLRGLLGFFADHSAATGQNGHMGAWLGYDAFRFQQNFTGFTQVSRSLEDVAGRGDLIEQANRTLSIGIDSRYRTRPYEPASWTRGAFEMGFDGRLDVIDQAQNLIDATVRSQTWDRRVDAGIRGGEVALWGDADWSVPYMRARLGLRGAVLFYDVDDRLGNFAPLVRPDDAFIVGFRRSALGLAVGPRASVEALPLDWLSLRAAYGEGYRSPQARTLDDGEEAPFTKVRSGDVGAKLSWGERLQITAAGYFTHLSDDVAFDAREGRLERIGASRRLGATVHMETHPLPWLVGAFSLTIVDAVLLEPPPPTAEDPQPAFVEGQQLPFVPPVVGRLDLGARHAIVRDLGGEALRGRVGAGLSYLASRPLPFGAYAKPVALLDAGAGVGWGPFELGLDLFNLLDVEYAATELSFPSNWDPSGPAPRVPARHTAAGAPLSWMASLEVAL